VAFHWTSYEAAPQELVWSSVLPLTHQKAWPSWQPFWQPDHQHFEGVVWEGCDGVLCFMEEVWGGYQAAVCMVSCSGQRASGDLQRSSSGLSDDPRLSERHARLGAAFGQHHYSDSHSRDYLSYCPWAFWEAHKEWIFQRVEKVCKEVYAQAHGLDLEKEYHNSE